ncbi:MAG: hypothetical protein L0228_07915 [Planctomycetes bacterium]|nr:hypothetical protein [Planctomycetota bacterium]
MNTMMHKFALTLLACLAAVTFAASPAAADTKLLLVSPDTDPGFFPEPYLPRFGFSSFNIGGVGERVTYVRWGGLASRFGLEPGDVILSMNGFPLTYQGSWNDALYNAMVNDGGWVRLRIRDVRTGFVATRQMFVGGGVGPVTHHYNVHGDSQHIGLPSGPMTQKSTIGPTNGNQSSPKLKKIANLLN